MALSKKEQEIFESLSKKKDAPEPPPVGRSISANIDLGDDKQVERAIKLGFLSPAEAEDDDDSGDDDSDDDSKKKAGARSSKPPGDKRPRRKGYFDS